MLLFIPRSLCALKRVAARQEHARYGATQGIRITLASGLYRAEATDGRMPIEDPPGLASRKCLTTPARLSSCPRTLERVCKVGDQFVQNRFDMVGMATVGSEVYVGLGNEVINTRPVGYASRRSTMSCPRSGPCSRSASTPSSSLRGC
jgi:hypothetical protein